MRSEVCSRRNDKILPHTPIRTACRPAPAIPSGRTCGASLCLRPVLCAHWRRVWYRVRPGSPGRGASSIAGAAAAWRAVGAAARIRVYGQQVGMPDTFKGWPPGLLSSTTGEQIDDAAHDRQAGGCSPQQKQGRGCVLPCISRVCLNMPNLAPLCMVWGGVISNEGITAKTRRRGNRNDPGILQPWGFPQPFPYRMQTATRAGRLSFVCRAGVCRYGYGMATALRICSSTAERLVSRRAVCIL